jgi:hypothetical protein
MARGKKRRSSPVNLDAAVEAVVAGASYKAAEEMTGVPRSTVRTRSCDVALCVGLFLDPAVRRAPAPA